MKTVPLLLALAGSLMAGAGLAGEAKPFDCTSPETTPEIVDCASKDFRDADADLNTAYKQLTAKLTVPAEKLALKTAQQAWIQFRDAQCDFESLPNTGGTLYPAVLRNCQARLTIVRTRELQEILNAPH